MELELNGKISIVTGAAGGIGRASAIEFASLGATVIVSDINADGARKTVEQITAAGGTALAVETDVTDEQQVKQLVDTAVEKFGRLDILYNNAGGSKPTPTEQITPADFRSTVSLNLFSMFNGIHAALPVMMEQKSGTILSTTSGAGLAAVPGLAAYGASKAGMISLTRSIATEFGQYGIRANIISPGSMDTVPFRQWLESLPGGDDDYFSQIPSGRLGTGEDIARTAAFLVSDYSSYINGATIPVDGGTASKLAIPHV